MLCWKPERLKPGLEKVTVQLNHRVSNQRRSQDMHVGLIGVSKLVVDMKTKCLECTK